MTKRDYKVYIRDILENMNVAEDFLRAVTFDKLSQNQKTAYAVIRCLEIIGEAAKYVPGAVRKKYPEIPWKRMAGMRDKVIHEYFGVVLEVVWKTVKEEIPEIKPAIKKILDELS